MDESGTNLVLGAEVGFSPGDFVLDADPAPSPKRVVPYPIFGHVYCGQTAAWINMPLATEVGLKVHSPQFLAIVCCGQTAG